MQSTLMLQQKLFKREYATAATINMDRNLRSFKEAFLRPEIHKDQMRPSGDTYLQL